MHPEPRKNISFAKQKAPKNFNSDNESISLYKKNDIELRQKNLIHLVSTNSKPLYKKKIGCKVKFWMICNEPFKITKDIKILLD